MPPNQPSKHKYTHEKKNMRKNGSAPGQELSALAKENPWRLFSVGEIRSIFNIGEAAMTRFRKLAARDQDTDPWINDLTRPEQFGTWLWGKRVELEKKHRDV